MFSVALIGISGFGAVHYDDLMRQVEKRSIRFVAATVINPEEETAKCDAMRAIGCKLFTDYGSMLEAFRGKIDLCMIPTGIHLHKRMTIAALDAGANVLVEKPAAATIQDIREMRAAEERAGRFVAVGFQDIYSSQTAAMKRALLAGDIGEIRSMSSTALWPRQASYYKRNCWAGKLRAEGQWVLDSPANNALAHPLNLMLFLAGGEVAGSSKLRDVEAELYRGYDFIESADTVCIRAHTDRGIRILFAGTHCSDGYRDPEIVIEGESGSMYWTFGRAWKKSGRGITEFDCQGGADLRDAMVESVLRRAADPAAFVCDLNIAAVLTLCVNGAHDASPVHTVSNGSIRRRGEGDNLEVFIEGVDELVELAGHRGALFSELRAPWGQAGRVVPMSGYQEFGRA